MASISVADEFVHHPAPERPIFIATDWYSTVKKQLPPPPAKGSALQASDEAELRQYQEKRSAADCARAKSEVRVSLQSFFAAPAGPLSTADVTKLSAFFERIRNDADFFIQKLKVDLPRQRPFLYMTDLKPCVAKEVTGAYPSGHAVLSALFAKILTDLYPAQNSVLAWRAQQIGDDRVLAGMHHRTDVRAGQEMAALIYSELKKSKTFAADLKLAAAQIAVPAAMPSKPSKTK